MTSLKELAAFERLAFFNTPNIYPKVLLSSTPPDPSRPEEDSQLIFDLQSETSPVFQLPWDPLDVLSEDAGLVVCVCVRRRWSPHTRVSENPNAIRAGVGCCWCGVS